MWINIQVFDLIPLVYLSVFMPIPSCFPYCSSIVELDVRDDDVFRSFFIVQNCFGYLFFFSYEIQYCSTKVCEGLCWDFDGDCMESVDCFW